MTTVAVMTVEQRLDLERNESGREVSEANV